MKNPITSAKRTYHKHKTKVAYGAGVATGIVVGVRVTKLVKPHIYAPISTELLHHLINNPEDALNYVHPTQGKITLFLDHHLEQK